MLFRSKIQTGGKKVEPGFEYSSGNNTEWIGTEEIKERLNNIEIH